MKKESIDLLAKLRAGDANVLKVIGAQFSGSLYQRIHSLHGLSYEDFEWLFNGALIALWKKRADIQYSGSIYHFLRVVVDRSVRHVQEYRRGAGLRTLSLDDLTTDVADEVSFYPVRLSTAENAHAVAELYKAIETLPYGQQSVILRTLKGQSNQEIAEALGLTPNAIRSQRTNAIKALRSRLSTLERPDDWSLFSRLSLLFWLLVVCLLLKKSWYGL